MQLPGPGVWGPPRDRGEALEVLRRAVELGVDHIDTAQYYGPDVANELIREALHPYPDNLALVSKVGARRDQTGGWLPYNQPDQLRSGIEDNLRSLGMEQLAAVNLRLTGDEPDQQFDDQLTAMIQAREDGLIGGAREPAEDAPGFDAGGIILFAEIGQSTFGCGPMSFAFLTILFKRIR